MTAPQDPKLLRARDRMDAASHEEWSAAACQTRWMGWGFPVNAASRSGGIGGGL